jgi:AcrR family transcriptional regulator
MRRVAQAVGLTAMAIYRHYPNREVLLNALADEGFQELAARLTGRRFSADLETRLAEIADVYLNHALENPRLFELMFLKPRKGARRYPRDFKARKSPTATVLADAIAGGMAAGKLKKGDPWEVTFEMGALSHGLILLFLGGRMTVTVTQFHAFNRRAFRRYFHGIHN